MRMDRKEFIKLFGLSAVGWRAVGLGAASFLAPRPASAMGSLTFASGTNRVTVSASSSLNNLTTGTYLAWIYPDDVTSVQGIHWKGLAATGYRRLHVGDGTNPNLNVWVARATTGLEATGNPSALGTNKWCFVAGVHDTGGASGDQRVWAGDLRTDAAEPTYDNQQVGSGAPGDNSSKDLIIGNRENNNRNFTGRIAWHGVWNRVMTGQEIIAQQWRPHVTGDGNCVLFMYPGRHGASGNQPDLSGNGNHGTVSGATLALPCPLPAMSG